MSIPFFPLPKVKRRRRRRAETSDVPTTLALVSATYDPDFSSVVLTFNQDINTDTADLSTICVNDAQFTSQLLRGMTTIGLTANSVTVEMEIVEPAFGTGVSLTVDVGNGIVPSVGGDEWYGVSGLALPFP